MTEWEAIQKRISCRSYQETPIDAEILKILEAMVDALNAESGLHIQLITSDGKNKPLLKLASAMFSGQVFTYAALVGGKDVISAEKIGYYGEKLVLKATQLGLGSCWVAGTFDAQSVCAEIGAEEKLWDVVPLGYPTEKIPVKQKMIRAGIRARDRKLAQFVDSELTFEQLPDWMQRAVEAVRMGPSAVNQQPVNFIYRDKKITAKLWKDSNAMVYNDLGIAKCQFETGAAAFGVQGHWDFGDGGEFHL